MRYYNAIYYKDVRLLVVYSPGSGGRDVLTIEVIRDAPSCELTDRLEYIL
jgi:hypothetical protein